MLLILFHDHWAALSEVPRCHKHHQYSKPLPADSDFRATEGHWYAAVLKRPAPLFWSRSAWLASPWLNPPDWRTADGRQIFGQRIMSFHPRGVKISQCTYRKCLRSKPGAPKVSILAASTHSSAFALRSAPLTEERAALERDAAERTALPRVFT